MVHRPDTTNGARTHCDSHTTAIPQPMVPAFQPKDVEMTYMNRIVNGRCALGAMTALAALCFTTSPASAVVPADPPVYIGAGDRYFASHDGRSLDISCTIAAPGKDSHGDRVALTAGHCDRDGQFRYALSPTGAVLGEFATVSQPSGMLAPVQSLDYAFIKLRPNVMLRPRPVHIKRIARATELSEVCKYGHGIVTEGGRCGAVRNITATDFCTVVPMSFGDSGGPVYRGGTLVGITSRLVDLSCGVMVATHADRAVADATTRGGVGAGFIPGVG